MSDLTRDLNRLWYQFAAVYSLLFLMAIAAMVTAGFFHYKQLAESFASSSRNSLAIHDMRQAILTLQPAVNHTFNHLEFEAPGGQIIFSLPPMNDAPTTKHSPFSVVFRVPIAQDTRSPNGEILGNLNFYYSITTSIGWGAFVWSLSLLFFAPVFHRARIFVEKRHLALIALERAEVAKQVARQVAHDIRSPLSALMAVEKNLHEISIEKRTLLLSASRRIRDIADDLLKSTEADVKTVPELLPAQPLLPLLKSIVREKKVQFQSRANLCISLDVLDDAATARARVSPVEFVRVISNLINNAEEATADPGRIAVRLRLQNSLIEIEISDDGKGIPAEHLEKLAAGGFTFGKRGGSGLGLAHAHHAINAWGGSIRVTSKLNHGTSIILNFSQAFPIARD